jgi:hypothetical protein
MIVKQMFKEQDLYNGCKDWIFDMLKTPYTRPEIPRPEGVPRVQISQGLADNWRVSAKRLDRDLKNLITSPWIMLLRQSLSRSSTNLT